VSSILDALRQLENARSQPSPDDMPPMESESNRMRWTLLALAGACVFGVFVTWVLWPSPPPMAPAPGPDASLASAVALPPAAPAPPPRVIDAEPPRAEMAAAAEVPVAETPPQRMAVRAPVTRTAPAPPPPELDELPGYDLAPEEAPTAGIGRTVPRPRGEPVVRIGSLTYSPSPTRRVVSLSVNNSQPIHVREGETVGGVEVTLIMPDGVYVKHKGNIFAVSR
jgi:hypothetical protein